MSSPPRRIVRTDVVILGAGAAGLFCAAETARRGRRVVAIDHAARLGEKIRISGGGRCNFTNVGTSPDQFLSENPKFCISALRGYQPRDFVSRIEAAGISWHEKELGQLFCDGKAQQVVDMLLDDCDRTGVDIRRETPITGVSHAGDEFTVETAHTNYTAPQLVIATGGKSIPKIGASGFGYQIAEQFGLRIVDPRPALVPLTFGGDVKDLASTLSGVSLPAAVRADTSVPGHWRPRPAPAFTHGLLFTHRGLSGPSILQSSSYWREGQSLSIDLVPGTDAAAMLREFRRDQGRRDIRLAMATLMPQRLAAELCDRNGWSGPIADWSDKRLDQIVTQLQAWRITPAGSEGYRTAEVTAGGVDTRDLDSRTMGARTVPGLFFIGEVVDVTGWLGGYNFQWAWASAYAAAQAMAS